ncbi:MAG: fibrillarin-like rRNA/tRNA 2'-O-methyltransferase [Methanobacteriota archaeon]
MSIRPTVHAGVFTDGSWLYTRNLAPGRAVYGEALRVEDGVEYRRWDAERSKLAAYLKKGGVQWPFLETTGVLYLGAASGTTASHLSDICPRGTIVAVEVAPRSFRGLVTVAEGRPNLLPLLGDASRPDAYASRVGRVDVVYQDIAQRDQEGIFLRNLAALRPGGIGFLMLKSRSVDVAARPADVVRVVREAIASKGFDVLDVRPLDPHAADHAAIVVAMRA